jgi:hypothetical protein
VTRGDAEAVLHAGATGGATLLDVPGGLVGAPLDNVEDLQVSIRPYSGSPWDGHHYCVEDWHVILVLWFEGGDETFKIQDAKALLDPISMQFELDGATLNTERTAVSRFQNEALLAEFGLVQGYVFQQGAIMSPEALAVGEHTLSWTVTSPNFEAFTMTTTFYIDPAGTGACL